MAAMIDVKQIRVKFIHNGIVDGNTYHNLLDYITYLEERMKKLEDDFHDHILLRQPLEQSEKKSEFVNR